jgi:hypothetical protein
MSNKLLLLITLILTINQLIISANTDSKIPEYLSIETDTSTSRPQVLEFLKQGLEALLAKYENDDIRSDYNDLFVKKTPFIFKEPNSWHTTCLYIGQNYSQLNTTIYKKFYENIPIDIVTSTLIYIPKKIISGPVFFKNFDLIQNQFPHITLMLGSYRAVDSNYVMRAIFDDNEYFKSLYKYGVIEDTTFTMVQTVKDVKIVFDDLKLEDNVKTVYVIKTGKVLNLNGYTKKNYSE